MTAFKEGIMSIVKQKYQYVCMILFALIFCLGMASPLQAFQVDVSHVYYTDPAVRVIDYDFSTGTLADNLISIPGAFVQKPSAESGLTYVYGLYPGSTGLSLQWSAGSPCRLQSAANANGAAVIMTTPGLPDTASAQTTWEYRIKLQNFADLGSDTNFMEAGLGAETGSGHPYIHAIWLPNGDLQLRGAIGGGGDAVWQSSMVTLTGLTPATTVLELRVKIDTGSHVAFAYRLNEGSWTEMDPYPIPGGTSIQAFPVHFPYLSIGVDMTFMAYSAHENDGKYYAAVQVSDPGQATYASISVAGSGCATLASSPLTYSSGYWRLFPPLLLSTNTPPSSCTQAFDFTAVKKAGGTDTAHKTITGYVEPFATSLQPTGTIGGMPTFYWVGIDGADRYHVELLDMSYNNLWWGSTRGIAPSGVNSLVYDGPSLTSGQTYRYNIVSNISGDISVARGLFTYSSSATATYICSIKDFADNAVSGAAVEMVGNPSVNTTTAADGSFALEGVPKGTPFTVKVSKTGYLPLYLTDWRYSFYKNFYMPTQMWFVLFTSAEVSSWGAVPGKGVIVGRTREYMSWDLLAGAVITYTSAQGKTYPVKYYNGTDFVDNPSTFDEGTFLILNVEDGDTVTVTAAKDGYNFTPKTFVAHADSVSICLNIGRPPVYSYHYLSGGNQWYQVNANIGDPTNTFASIAMSGPEILVPVPLSYDSFNRQWNGVYSFGSSPPALTGPYTLTMAYKAGGPPLIQDYTVAGFTGLPTNILPASGAIVNSSPVFSWTGAGSGNTYYVELYDSNAKIVWAKSALTTTSVAYDGLPLSNGNYTFNVYVFEANGDYSDAYSGNGLGFTYVAQPVYGAFAGAGIWKWDGSAWSQVTPNAPTAMADSGLVLYGNFGAGAGIWKWGGSAWSQVTPNAPTAMAASGLTLYGNFGTGAGIWKWNGTTWSQVTPNAPLAMAVSGSILYGNFGAGAGIWKWDGSAWSQVTPNTPQAMAVSGSLLYGVFSPGGIWQWNGTAWSQLTPNVPQTITTSGSILYGNFGTGAGIWKWNGTTWSQITPNAPTAMTASGSILYGNFGAGAGIWKWDGSNWSQVTPNAPTSMVMGN
jgi:hypothetical protein